jgi:hypothetical protein
MMSISQIDMVVWREARRELQVCGSLALSEGNAPVTGVAEFLVVVRQDDSVATFQGTRTAGTWQFTVAPGPEAHFTAGRPAVASAVAILRHEPAGLKTISWVQPVEIADEDADRNRPPEESRQVPDFEPDRVDPPTEGELTTEHSISSSLAIFQTDRSGETYRWEEMVEKVKVPDQS